ncbi:MAG: MerR family transcriptional regulator, partial [Actinobacteria bacterium]|nr:MerR family transcriptional regulator [Actinomycetota bacterium]
SKIRFLEAEGLVEPARTPTGYRKFSPTDVDRLRYTLTMQRDHFLPLRVIREHLDKIDRGFVPAVVPESEPSVPEVATDRGTVASPTLRRSDDRHDVSMSAENLAEQSGLTAPEISNLRRMGIITPDEKTDEYNLHSLHVARSVARLHTFGVESKHLSRVFNAAARQAELVVGLVKPQLAGRSIDDLQAERALDQAEEMAAELLSLQSLAMTASLQAEFD